MSKTLNAITAAMRLAIQLLKAGEYEASCRQSDRANELLRQELGKDLPKVAPLATEKPK